MHVHLPAAHQGDGLRARFHWSLDALLLPNVWADSRFETTPCKTDILVAV